LNCLTDFSTQELRLLIEFLGLHDLSIEIRQIIDTVKLKKIHSILSKEKTAFLQSLLHKKEPVIFKKMELFNWNGEAETLLQMIKKRGLNRLAKGLYPENTNLIWYVKHRMSCEEEALFSSLHKKLEQPKAYLLLKSEILDIANFLLKNKTQVGS
jgi:hypothetical protein